MHVQLFRLRNLQAIGITSILPVRGSSVFSRQHFPQLSHKSSHSQSLIWVRVFFFQNLSIVFSILIFGYHEATNELKKAGLFNTVKLVICMNEIIRQVLPVDSIYFFGLGFCFFLRQTLSFLTIAQSFG